MVGRPTIFTQELADQICERIAEGESLRKICLDAEMPGMATVFRWLANEELKQFREQYAYARETQADVFADELIDIADTPQPGEKKTVLANGKTEVVHLDMIEHRRLRIDTRKWVAAKLKPKKYSEKLDLTHANPDGSNLAPPVFGISFNNGGPGTSPVETSSDIPPDSGGDGVTAT